MGQQLSGCDEATGDVGGLSFWERAPALAAFRATARAATIPTADEAGDVRREVRELRSPLGPARGPSTAVGVAATAGRAEA